MTTGTTDLGAAIEAFILEHEYCGELDAAMVMDVYFDTSSVSAHYRTNPVEATSSISLMFYAACLKNFTLQRANFLKYEAARTPPDRVAASLDTPPSRA